MPAAAPARDRLVAAALRRFAADGVLATTLDDVRAEAGVSVGAIYHHFPDKRSLAAAVHVHALGAYQRSFLAVLDEHPDPVAAIRAVVAHTLRWCEEHPDAATVLLQGPPPGADPAQLNRDFFARVRTWWAGHVHHGALHDLPIAVIAAVWLGPALELVRHGHVPTRRDATVLAEAAVAALVTKEPVP